MDLVVPTLRSMLYKLSRYEAAKEQTRRGLRVLKSFISVVKISVGEMEMSIEPELGTADSGDLELDLPDLFGAVGEAARAALRPICLVVDELQYLSETEFSALIMAMHRVAQDQAPVYFIGAGLPQIRMLAGNSKSYSERLFRFPDIGPLAAEDAMDALQRPAEEEGARFADDAAAEILRITQGYPYFLQQWGYETWNYAAAELFTLDDVKAASRNAIEELDRSFFRVRFERCTDAEKRYMRALAALGDGSHRSGDVADLLGVKVTSAAPRRNILIKKGMIYSRAHGEIAFSVPLFHEFMEREMPDWPEKG